MKGHCCRENGCCGGTVPGTCCYAAPTAKACVYKLSATLGAVLALASGAWLLCGPGGAIHLAEGVAEGEDQPLQWSDHQDEWAACLVAGIVGDTLLLLGALAGMCCCTSPTFCCGQAGAAFANALATLFLVASLVVFEVLGHHTRRHPGGEADGSGVGAGDHEHHGQDVWHSPWTWRAVLAAPALLAACTACLGAAHARDMHVRSAHAYTAPLLSVNAETPLNSKKQEAACMMQHYGAGSIA